jgi:hypothetical protein
MAMTEQEQAFLAARRRVIRRIRKRLIFGVNLLLYLLVVIFSHDPNVVGSAVPLWTPLLLIHFIYAFDIWSKTWGRWIEHATRREMERMQRQADSMAYVAAEKRKREKAKRLSLSDDGELIADDDDDEALRAATQASADGKQRP